MIDVLYFAWIRERIGERSEQIESDAATVTELVEELRTRSEAHALA
ncbi:MAG: MoaD/ThiS family protein, partial [Boseongicola sp.]|nr:MoaD/ThiS family protein [Boseongicola sp.]